MTVNDDGWEGSLTALHETTRRMMSTESVADVADIVRDAAERLLDARVAGVYVLEDGELQPTTPPGLPPSIERECRRIATEPTTATEPRTTQLTAADGTTYTLIVHRLGEYGSLIVGRTTERDLSSHEVELVRILATNGAVALERAVQLRTLRKRESQLVDERNRLAALFENIPSPTASFVIKDGKPVGESVNPAFERVFGYSQSELEGDQIDDYIVPAGQESEATYYNDLLQEGKNVNVEVRRRTETGHRDFLLDVVPFRLNAPNVHGYAMYTDITERKRREQELERQNERLEEFASIVSHDIRNPLNVAQGFVDVARENPDEEYFDRVEAALDRVDDIVESVLTLARHGRTVTDPIPTNIASTAESAWKNVATQDAALEIASTADRSLYGDATRLTTLFENLFRNALDHGGPNVTVTVGVLEDDRGFFVMDDGPGIPEEHSHQIFESGFTTRTDGTGYGLAIVQEIVDAYDWTITLGEQESGARFEIQDVRWVAEAKVETEREPGLTEDGGDDVPDSGT